jgi:phosphatidylglycerol:prolipoprotein diacylglycerol transferase
MFPVIGTIGPFTVYSFGVMAAVAILICAWLFSLDAKKRKIDPAVAYDLVFWLVVGGVLGARVFYVLLNLEYFFQNPIEIIMIQRGGLAWQGGFIVGALSGIVFVRKNKLPLTLMLDLSAPYLALGQSIGRIGCFLNGCCYGKAVEWGIYCPLHGEKLHPAQLYDVVGLLIIFFILKGLQKRQSFDAQIFFAYILMAASLRFVNEFFRGDHDRTWFGLSVYQYVCVFLLTIGVYGYARLKSYRRQ